MIRILKSWEAIPMSTYNVWIKVDIMCRDYGCISFWNLLCYLPRRHHSGRARKLFLRGGRLGRQISASPSAPIVHSCILSSVRSQVCLPLLCVSKPKRRYRLIILDRYVLYVKQAFRDQEWWISLFFLLYPLFCEQFVWGNNSF